MSDKLSEFTVRLNPSEKQFSTLSNISILESGLSAGITLPFGCANGSCGDCRAKIVSGQFKKIRPHDYPLTESEKLNNVCLLCSYAAVSDLVIEVSEAISVDDIPFQQTRGKLCHLEQLNGIWITRFKLTRSKALRYLPGQYASVTLPGQEPVNLAIANCPCESSYLEFHIAVTTGLPIDKLKPLDRVTIDGPIGSFTLNDLKRLPASQASHQNKAVLFVAVGPGISAIKPLIEHILSLDDERSCALLWVDTSEKGHYLHNLCRSWADAFDHFSYFQIYDTTKLKVAIDDWSLQIADAETYVCGDPHVYQDIRVSLSEAGVNPIMIIEDRTV